MGEGRELSPCISSQNHIAREHYSQQQVVFCTLVGGIDEKGEFCVKQGTLCKQEWGGGGLFTVYTSVGELWRPDAAPQLHPEFTIHYCTEEGGVMVMGFTTPRGEGTVQGGKTTLSFGSQ